MGVLNKSAGGGLNLGTPPPPPGTHVAVCVKVLDQYGVNPADIGWTQEAEKGVKQVDVTRFIFGVLGPDQKTYYVATKLLRISGNEKSGLYKLLTTWLGKPPAYGRDYAVEASADPEMGCLHRSGMISVAHTAKGDRVYADVGAVMPLPPGFPVPAVADWNPGTVAADAYRSQGQQQAPPAATQPAGSGAWNAPTTAPANAAPQTAPGGAWNVAGRAPAKGDDKIPF